MERLPWNGTRILVSPALAVDVNACLVGTCCGVVANIFNGNVLHCGLLTGYTDGPRGPAVPFESDVVQVWRDRQRYSDS